METGIDLRGLAFAGGVAWEEPDVTTRHNLILVRHGAFRLRTRGLETIADPTLAWASEPGVEAQTGLLPCGDAVTVVDVPAELAAELWPRLEGPAVPVDARIEVAHRLLLRAARDGDLGYGGVEALGLLLGGPRRTHHASSPRPHALADAAREAVLTGHPAAGGLVALARHLGTSPFTLSRAFTTRTGQTLTRYRNRIRLSRALHRLEQGERDLAGLAADLGFADQAHLTRAMTAHIGLPPGRVRALIGTG